MGGFGGSDDGQQRFEALHRANRVRLARAELKQRIRTGVVAAAEVILECPWQAENMSVSDVLMSQKRWGETRCRRLLVSVGIPEDKKVGSLTERQRAALVTTLGGRMPDGTGPPAKRPQPTMPSAPRPAQARQLSPV